MSMKSSEALEKYISRDCIGHQQVGIDIQRFVLPSASQR